jgi:hypothetical protein
MLQPMASLLQHYIIIRSRGREMEWTPDKLPIAKSCHLHHQLASLVLKQTAHSCVPEPRGR